MAGRQDEDEVAPELCDLCGTAIADGSEVYSTVRDSSAIHAHDARYDGERLLGPARRAIWAS